MSPEGFVGLYSFLSHSDLLPFWIKLIGLINLFLYGFVSYPWKSIVIPLGGNFDFVIKELFPFRYCIGISNNFYFIFRFFNLISFQVRDFREPINLVNNPPLGLMLFTFLIQIKESIKGLFVIDFK